MYKNINKTSIQHFIKNQPITGVFPNDKLHGGHLEHMMKQTEDPMKSFVEHLEFKKSQEKGGHMGEPTDVGGSVQMGGGFNSFTEADVPNSPEDMYHFLLTLNPQQIEMFREISAQLLGSEASPMWGGLIGGQEALESEPEEYENMIRMPNSHAAARMVEAEHGYGKGGGFYKAVKHIARKAAGIYKAGHHALKWANRNKDLLLELPGVRDYKDQVSSFLDTANAYDNAVNPIVDAAYSATGQAATKADRDKLKNLAYQSVEKAVDTHMPEAKKYIEAAKDVHKTYNQLKHSNYPVNAL